MIEIKNSASELNDLLSKHNKCIIDFYTTWCGPCRMLTPELEKLEKSHPEWQVIRVDAEKFPELFQQTNSQGVPTICFAVGKEWKEVVVGFRPVAELEKIIKKY